MYGDSVIWKCVALSSKNQCLVSCPEDVTIPTRTRCMRRLLAASFKAGNTTSTDRSSWSVTSACLYCCILVYILVYIAASLPVHSVSLHRVTTYVVSDRFNLVLAQSNIVVCVNSNPD